MGAPPVAPVRPDVTPLEGRPRAGGWATLAVVATIVVVVFGGYVMAAALSEPVGEPVGIPGVVSIRLLSGWIDAGGGEGLGGSTYVQVTRGSGNLQANVTDPFRGDPQTLAERYRDDVLSARLSQLSVSRSLESVRLNDGSSALRFAYVGVIAETGTSVEGEVTILVTTTGHGIVFNAWAPSGLLSFVRADVRTMVRGAEVG